MIQAPAAGMIRQPSAASGRAPVLRHASSEHRSKPAIWLEQSYEKPSSTVDA